MNTNLNIPENLTDRLIAAVQFAINQRAAFGKDSEQYRAAAALCERLNRQVERLTAPKEAA